MAIVFSLVFNLHGTISMKVVSYRKCNVDSENMFVIYDTLIRNPGFTVFNLKKKFWTWTEASIAVRHVMIYSLNL